MSFRSLPRNDPARNEYRLWIFVSTREHLLATEQPSGG